VTGPDTPLVSERSPEVAASQAARLRETQLHLDVQALRVARVQATQLQSGVPRAQTRVRWGWTPEHYARLTALGEQAAAQGTALGYLPPGAAIVPVALRATQELTYWAEKRVRLTVPFSVVEPWLILLMIQTDRRSADLVRELLKEDDGAWMTDVAETLGSDAVLAWSAGIPWAEAAAARDAGTWDQTRVRTLAGLRGLAVPG
jgi:hypothetical protein